MFVVRDQGLGFDLNTLPDPTDPANLEKASGRGVLLMRMLMDEVKNNRVGNAVTLVKYADGGHTTTHQSMEPVLPVNHDGGRNI